MGFFKNLKKRLFTLNVEEKEDKKVKSEKPSVKQDKVDKQLKKQIKKERKINKFVSGLDKSGSSLSQKIKEIQAKHNEIDEEFFEDLEDVLIMSDISAKLVLEIIDAIKMAVKVENVTDPKLINEIIVDKLFSIYATGSLIDTSLNIDNDGINVILVVGVNGSGKTTTIAKIANNLKKEGKKVLLCAGDTFRAGAVEQLNVWASRIGVDIVKPLKEGADPASVVYDGVEKAKAGNYDVLIVDTAGRLQNKVNLMNELAKINKIIKREIPNAPHESLLVVDATTGQNGVSQATSFKDVTPLTGLVLTKMDGTSKGGIVLTIKDKLNLDVKLIGLGEGLDDLQEFDLDAFIYGLTKDLMEKE